MKKKLIIIISSVLALVLIFCFLYSYISDYAIRKGLDVLSEMQDNNIEFSKKDNLQNEEDENPENSVKQPISTVSNADREYVMNIYSRYSSAEVAEVLNLATGGITPQEKKRIKEIVFSKMSRAEYDEIIRLSNKYNYSYNDIKQ